MEIWAATRDPAAAGHPFPAPYSVQTLRDELELRPVVVREGVVTDVDPLSGEAEREFPEPVGRASGIYTLHSELATLPETFPTLREASFRLCLSPGLLEKLFALEEGEFPEPYTQSEASVAVHLVEMAGESSRVEGMTITRGGSAKSTSEPAARAAFELRGGQARGSGRAAARVRDRRPRGVPRAARHRGRIQALTALCGSSHACGSRRGGKRWHARGLRGSCEMPPRSRRNPGRAVWRSTRCSRSGGRRGGSCCVTPALSRWESPLSAGSRLRPAELPRPVWSSSARGSPG